jgi:copper(I)-binding protein
MRIAAVLLAALMTACGAPESPVMVSDIDITKPMPGRHMSAGFLIISNNTKEPIRITRVESPQFASVEIHETTIEDGIARMRELEELLVPAGGNVTLERGGKHLMLMRPQDLGESVTLHFFSEEIPVLTVDYLFAGGNKDQ